MLRVFNAVVFLLASVLADQTCLAGEQWANLPARSKTVTVKLDHLTKLSREKVVAQAKADARRDASRTPPEDGKPGQLLLINAVYVNPKGPFRAGFFSLGCETPQVDRFVEHIRVTKYGIVDGYGTTASPFAEDYEKAYNTETRTLAQERFGKDVFDRIQHEGKAAHSTYMATQPPPSRIAYVVDTSQVAAPYWPDMIAEVKLSVSKLLPQVQGFSIVLARNGRALELVDGPSKLATPARKIEAFAAIDKGRLQPAGDADMLKAIEKALAYKPRYLFIITTDVRGNGPKQPTPKRFLAKLDKLFAAVEHKPRAVNVLQWVQIDPTGTGKRVGEKYGRFVYLSAEQLEKKKAERKSSQ